YLESVGDDRRGPRRKESRGKGPQAAAVGEDEPRAWLEGGDGLPAAGRPHAVSRAAAVPFGGLRLHHLHRQLGAPPGGRVGRGRGGRAGGLRGDRKSTR